MKFTCASGTRFAALDTRRVRFAPTKIMRRRPSRTTTSAAGCIWWACAKEPLGSCIATAPWGEPTRTPSAPWKSTPIGASAATPPSRASFLATSTTCASTTAGCPPRRCGRSISANRRPPASRAMRLPRRRRVSSRIGSSMKAKARSARLRRRPRRRNSRARLGPRATAAGRSASTAKTTPC